jgi:hypothetical protein
MVLYTNRVVQKPQFLNNNLWLADNQPGYRTSPLYSGNFPDVILKLFQNSILIFPSKIPIFRILDAPLWLKILQFFQRACA